MMTSLFSSFDPQTNINQMNWFMILTPTILLPMTYWMKKSRLNMTMKMTENIIINEMKNITNKKEMLIMSMSIFIMILTINLMGLFPYVFTPTSHICLSMSLALPIWMMMMIYGWMKFTNKMFIHLLPMGTPTMIMPMMIIIETMGNIIRPIALSVRLTANMIAGHLLMTLLGDMNNINLIYIILPMQMLLMMFESAISTIQAYVFCTLMTLYSSEIP
uniref:ATP synthase F0 subunit 6 n=1 Tax=Tenguna kuankuoshuiensis TaxID=3054878 RepID=UPI0026E487E9|nr:ATP synthase F0 subunit 6 [Tenguna kuankuoshuiensis]WJE88876.1 ATP synthase F0 subunit 6 [Tenguna kuankuoshuiensis]